MGRPDRATIIRLELARETLEQPVNNCPEQGDNDFARLRAVLASY
jgi:hypothetical protein